MILLLTKVILKSIEVLAPDAVIPAKAGIQVLFLGPRFRGDDNRADFASANAKPAVAEPAPKFPLWFKA